MRAIRSERGASGRGKSAASVPEEVLDDLEAALTRIDVSGTDDEPLVRPTKSTTEGSQGSGGIRRLRVVSSSSQDVGSTVLETAPSGTVRGSESRTASTIQASSRLIKARDGSSLVPDSEKTVGEERGQRDRPESQGQASSGTTRMGHNRFEVLAERNGEEGVDHHDFLGGELDTESLADVHPCKSSQSIQYRRVIGAFAQLDVVVDKGVRKTRAHHEDGPIRDERSVPGGHEGCSR